MTTKQLACAMIFAAGEAGAFVPLVASGFNPIPKARVSTASGCQANGRNHHCCGISSAQSEMLAMRRRRGGRLRARVGRPDDDEREAREMAELREQKLADWKAMFKSGQVKGARVC